MLTRHFLWTYFPGNEFTSWSSSLLYALQFAMRKTRNKVKTGKVSSECDIKLCVLDTSSLSTSSFFAAPELIRLYGIPSSNGMRHEYHDNEYLFHGKLNVKRISSTITLARLREEGLFNLIPELDEEAHKTHLFLRVRDLRRSLFNIPRPISAVDGGLALWIASLFSQAFTMPMFVALSSLCRRDPGDKGFLRILRHYAGKAIELNYSKA